MNQSPSVEIAPALPLPLARFLKLETRMRVRRCTGQHGDSLKHR
jgi:hypothetical protein